MKAYETVKRVLKAYWTREKAEGLSSLFLLLFSFQKKLRNEKQQEGQKAEKQESKERET